MARGFEEYIRRIASATAGGTTESMRRDAEILRIWNLRDTKLDARVDLAVSYWNRKHNVPPGAV